jgi:Asparagine synthase
MQELLNYNFDAAHVHDRDFGALYRTRRRDSIFAFAYRDDDGTVFALRDHLGAAPLYWRHAAGEPRFSTSLADLVEDGDELDEHGVELFLAFGTTKLGPLVRGIGVVPPGSVVRFGPDGVPVTVYHYDIAVDPMLALSRADLVDELDRLMRQAVGRSLRHDDVGIYMSGGIDSALTAIYLKQAGARVTAYTSAPWGEGGLEVPFAKINAERTGVDEHVIVPLETARYQRYVDASRELYGSPFGQTTMIGVTSLWDSGSLAARGQIYFGQNTDTMTCSTAQQELVYFLHRIPRELRRRLDQRLCCTTMLADYLSLYTHGQVTRYEPFERVYGGLDPLRLLTLAGMLVVHSPVDGECLSLPAVRRGIPASNPYYDVDLVEFCLRIPLRHRIGVSRSSKIGLTLDKRAYRMLAERHLPKELVHRKKAFTVPFKRDDETRSFQASLPATFGDRILVGDQERFAASVLAPFVDEHRLRLDSTSNAALSGIAG